MAMHQRARHPVVRWDEGTRIPASDFRHGVTGADTDGRFCLLKATMPQGAFVWPHTHTNEDEITFVFRGRIGARVGDEDVVVEEGDFLFKPRGVPHAMWNMHAEASLLHEIITPAGFEGLFEEMGELHLQTPEPPRGSREELATRYGLIINQDLIAELVEKHSLQP
jgi:quercetin dioxygenase-like cupin family protein